ncbi:histone deacetylase [Spirulina sp. 06S082]|uniref:histone deacetylase family protein n=1 Tax=Spirulina sp. 06S082 TaxID=3110248 RepID=UPI002B1EEC2B|nr:histone deacetylase [Spirulina sp. 06S082]MEA5468150.1 histone deacetylase [Spirulina sp. 06S082]
MMKLPVIYSDRFLEHDTGYSHPECPQRLTAIVEALKKASWRDRLQWQEPTPLKERNAIPWLLKVHPQHHLDRVKLAAEENIGLDLDTPVSSQSYEVALLAVNGWLDGVDLALATDNPALVLARPPGHHAERDRAMGFCLFSNAAIAAYYALEQPNIERVAILDWDVHHGNGTQHIIENHPQLAYCSLHQFPCYPGTGRAEEQGMHDNVLNLPMSPGNTLIEYQAAFTEKVLPFLKNFSPDLLIVSAGYDANKADPLAGMSLESFDYRLFTEYSLQITRRVVYGLEGGYDFQALAESVKATVEGCFVGA